MPWNDNANPGPWGSPPGSNDDRPDESPRLDPGRRPPSPPPPPSGPDFREYLRRLRADWDRYYVAKERRHAALARVVAGV